MKFLFDSLVIDGKVVMNITLSVIIPVYNVEKYIERCTRSLMAQTLKDGIEFLFINDCTPDKSVDIIKSVLAEHPERIRQVRIIEMPVNSGQGTVRKRGIQEAKGDYIIHCDSDDWIEPNMYELLLKKAEETDADIVICDFYHEFANHREVEEYSVIESKDSILLGQNLWWTFWSRIIKRSLLLDKKIYPIEGVNCLEDFLVLNKATYYANKIEHVNKPLYHYNRTNENSMLNMNNTEQKVYYISLVAKDLYDYFKEKEDWVANHFKVFYQKAEYGKIVAREKYLTKENYDIKKWKETFPKTWPYVWNNKKRRLLYRICFVLADFGFTLPLRIRCYLKNR